MTTPQAFAYGLMTGFAVGFAFGLVLYFVAFPRGWSKRQTPKETPLPHFSPDSTPRAVRTLPYRAPVNGRHQPEGATEAQTQRIKR